MNDIDHMIAVLQASKEGKMIQSRHRSYESSDWIDVAGSNMWDWYTFDYRIKPTEPRRLWLNWYPALGRLSSAFYDSREEAASVARVEVSQQIEFVEVVK